MNRNIKNILLITYYFPPEINGGASRPYLLYRYLSKIGYKVIVLTKKIDDYIEEDKNIHRFDSLAGWREHFSIKKFLYKIFSKLQSFFGYQDNDTYWVSGGIHCARGLIKKYNIDLIYATYPSFGVLNLGFKISKRYSLPLIIEYRDGFLHEPIEKNKKYIQAIKKIFEKRILKKASAVITVGKKLSIYFADKYPGSKVFTVYSGFEDDFIFSKINKERKIDDKIRIVHFGGINTSRPRNIDNLFMAVRALKNKKIINKNNFKLSFIGKYFKWEKEFAKIIGIDGLVIFHEPMKKNAGLQKIAKEYNYLLLFGVEGKQSVIPGKLFDYLALEKPILGICKGSEAGLIIKATGTGEVCDFKKNNIKELFKKALQNRIKYKPNKKEIEKYNFKNQANKIDNIIKKIK